MPTWDIAYQQAAVLIPGPPAGWSDPTRALTDNGQGALNDPAVATTALWDPIHLYDPIEIGGTAPADDDTIQGFEHFLEVRKNNTLNAANTFYGMKVGGGDSWKSVISQVGTLLFTADIAGNGWHALSVGGASNMLGFLNISGLQVKLATFGVNVFRPTDTPDPSTYSSGSDAAQTRELDYFWTRIHYSVASGGGGTTTALAAAASARYIPGIGIRSQGSIIRRS